MISLIEKASLYNLLTLRKKYFLHSEINSLHSSGTSLLTEKRKIRIPSSPLSLGKGLGDLAFKLCVSLEFNQKN